MLREALSRVIYVKIYENRFVLKRVGDDSIPPMTVVADQPFTTKRLLIGQFSSAESALRRGFRGLLPKRWFIPSPEVVMHPMEKVEGGLSEIEDRIFRELALSAGAHKAVVWLGRELSDVEVRRQVIQA